MIERFGTRPLRPAAVVPLALAVAALAVPVALAADADCATCHDNLSTTWETTVHGRLAAFETADGVTGCVTCHGDGTAHVDSGGDPEQIRGLGEGVPIEDVTEVCTSCHRSRSLHDWVGSEHELSGVGCTDCHDVHEARASVQTYSETCMDCHTEVRAQFNYPSHHPVREGHMSCLSCHTPHGSSIGMLKNEERPQELCFDCHAQYSGPFVFEHEPVFEGCDTCHEPHGAVANNLLVQNEPFLCLQCHEMHFHAGLQADETESGTWYIPAYDPAVGNAFDAGYPDGLVPIPNGESGYRRAFTTKCTQCHTRVHGTDQPSQTVPSLGRGLMN